MYNLETLQTGLAGLVGYHQLDDASISAANLYGPLIVSRSGLYIDQYHPLVTHKNIWETFRYRNSYQESGPGMYAEKLDQILADSIADVFSDIRTRKLSRMEGRSLLAETQLYDGEGSIYSPIDPAGRFVGLRLTVANKYQAIALRQLGLQLLGAVTELNIYVYADNQSAPLATIPVTFTGTGRMQWAVATTPVILSGYNSYTIGYYQADLGSARAVRRGTTIDIQACSSCSPQNAYLWSLWKPFVSVRAARIDATRLNSDRTLWVEDSIDSVNEQNYGLNLLISAECDLTNLFVEQQMLLASAIRQKASNRILGEIAFSTMTTGTEQMIRDKANYALKNGEEKKYDDLITGVDMEFSKLDPRCLPEVGTMKHPVKKSMF